MNEKGICKEHGEFILAEGCPQCLAKGKLPFIETEEPIVIARAAPVGTALVRVKPEQDIEVQSFYDQAIKLQEYAQQRVIAMADDLKPATDDLSIIARVKKAFEEKRKEYVKPLQDHVKEVNEAFKALMLPIEDADSITRRKILAFQQEQDRIRREQEEINRKRQEAAEAEMRLKGELTESVNLVEVTPEAPTIVRTDMGMVGTTKIWKWEVVDFSLLPDRFKMENATLIGKVVRAGEREIPGIKIWSEDTLRVTAK